MCFELKLKIDLQRTNADELELDLRCGAERRTICLFHFKKGGNACGQKRGGRLE